MTSTFRFVSLILFSCCLSTAASSTALADPASDTATGVVFADRNNNGQQDAGEPGVGKVGVSNGREVVQTDEQGRYKISVDEDTIVFVIKPTGYRTALDEDHLSRFYYIHKPNGSREGLKFPGVEPTGPLPKQINFPLVPQQEDTSFEVLFFGDPQPRNQQEIDYIAHDVVEPLIGSDAAFGVTLGDILFDDLNLFDSFNHTVGRIGIPWYNVIGNHDINYAAARDEDSDETFERVYGPAYYSFNYGGVHFINIDDVHWMSDGNRMLYRSGLSDKQLKFIENDLALVPQDTLVVAMMHIPLVKSTPWLQPKRERLFRLLESRSHCVSLSGHTHHHEHVMIGAEDGWKNPRPHHHIINVTVCGSWWSGQPDENEIPHTMCKDGTPNGYTIMHFDGDQYMLEYRAARKDPAYQVRIMAEEELKPGDAEKAQFFANVFNAMPDAVVEWKFLDSDRWQPMQKAAQVDPAFQKLWKAEQPRKANKTLPWRQLPSPMKSPHLWSAEIPADLPVGTYGLQVRCTNPNGQVLTGNRIFRVAAVAGGQ